MVIDVAEIEKRVNDSYELPNSVIAVVQQPLVTVRTSTYQHGAFIRQCIEGVLMQKTAFPFEFIIGEDFSTDGTRQIVFEYAQRYPNVIRVITADYNVGMKANGTRCMRRARGKYIALCEGDDYWTDPLKLQKQVDFLEANLEYSVCCGAYESLNMSTGERYAVNLYDRIADGRYQDPRFEGASFGLAEMENNWLIKTLTVLFRTDAGRGYETKDYRYSRDTHLFYHIAKAGKAFYFNRVFGVYRIHPGGIKSANEGRVNTNISYQVYRELYEKNGDEFTRRMHLKSLLVLLGYDLFHVYEENTVKRKLELLLEAFRLIRSRSEYVWLLRPFLPLQIRILLRK
jgi:glycosyltransferase involved in cell wall biosynthesis